MKKFLLFILLTFSFTSFSQEKLNNEMIVELVQAGFSDQIVQTKIDASENSEFDTTTTALINLKKNKVSDSIISAMVEYQTRPSEETVEDIDTDWMIYAVTSINATDEEIIINDQVKLNKGDELQIYLPANKQRDFQFIEKKKSIVTGKMLGAVADIASSGALVMLSGSNSIDGVMNAYKVMRTANAVSWGADALEKIEELEISKTAKKLAGKKVEILDWAYDEDGEVLVNVQLGKKKYKVQILGALVLGEVKIIE